MRAPSQPLATGLESNALDLVCAPASLKTGALLDENLPERARERLEGLAATLPDLFGTLDPTCLDRIAERLGGEPGDTTISLTESELANTDAKKMVITGQRGANITVIPAPTQVPVSP